MQPKAAASGPTSRVVRAADLLLAMLVIVSAGFLVSRPDLPGSSDLIPTTFLADFSFGAAGIALAYALWRMDSSPEHGGRSSLRAAVYGLALVLSGMAISRCITRLRWSQLDDVWPPVAHASRVDSLSPRNAAEWGVRVALHAASAQPQVSEIPAIPAEWPFPKGVRLAVRTTEHGSAEFWAQAGGVACHAESAPASDDVASTVLQIQCDASATTPAELAFELPNRRATDLTILETGSPATPWRQHRGDAHRGGSASTQPRLGAKLTNWKAPTDTKVRAAVSVIGDLVLVGGHGTGLLIALDLATGARRWTARAPNWIHQEPVSDGRIVVVGFGDNDRSFFGRAPSGVAAFDLQSGRRLWTRFDESSVMTSPVILDSVLLYGSAAGMLRKRHLGTGALLGEARLPGGVIMGPPTLSGDTLVTTLDEARVCAFLASSLRALWCIPLTTWRMVGHASAAISEGGVVVSGMATALTPTLMTFLRMPAELQARLVRALFFPLYQDKGYTAPSGQQFAGIQLSTGHVFWTSPLFASRRTVDGHPAGTATIADGIGVITLPVADTVVAFDARTGRVLWTSGANEARGPALILDGQVIVAGRNGIVELRRLSDGTLTCTITRKLGFDRAGPVRASGLVIFANLEGEVEAIPVSELMSCTAFGASRPQLRN